MIAWSRRRTLVAGVALILTVNLIALAGVAYNRSSATSTLQLSERELRLPGGRLSHQENSGVALSLVWRVDRANDALSADYGSYSGVADWLDRAKLVALGFDLPPDQADRKNPHWPSKELLLVLEFDGPAYRRSLERAQKKADDEEKLKLDNPGNKEFERRAKQARESAENELRASSRLFVVDAGLDADVLRAQYPDPAHALIVRGQIRPQRVTRGKLDRLAGHVSALSVSQINVPLAFQPALKPVAATDKKPSFSATLAFGQRLEPWVVALTQKQE